MIQKAGRDTKIKSVHEQFKNKGMRGGRLLRFNSLPSTNQWALENIHSCRHGDVVWAVRQTAGRGRFQRKWFTPKNTCLTISIIVKPQEPEDYNTSFMGQTAALAVRSTLEKLAIEALLKWPNDVLAGDRKIAGILAERDPRTKALVLGIGLNVNLKSEDLSGVSLLQPVTSMAMERKRTFRPERICAQLLAELEVMLDLVARDGPGSLLDIWSRYDFLKGKPIEIRTHDGSAAGKYDGLDKDGRLRLIDDAGMKHIFWSGDVSLRTQDCGKPQLNL